VGVILVIKGHALEEDSGIPALSSSILVFLFCRGMK
jgi:hypothetical protein